MIPPCPHPDPCASTVIHQLRDCRCECQRLLRNHPPLPHPGKLTSWRDTHGAQAAFAYRGDPITLSHQTLDDGQGFCVGCGKRVVTWGDGRPRHVKSEVAV